MDDRHHYWPLADRQIVALVVLILLVTTIVLVNAVSLAYRRLGISGGWALALLFTSLVGSYLNIPLARLPTEARFEPTLVRVYGMLYVVPRRVQPTKVLAVNVGGAIVPTLLSAYLLAHDDLWWPAIPAVLVVTVVVHLAARVVPGVGVTVPLFVPPIVAVVTALIFGGTAIAAVAYVGGTLGTLIGGDLLSLRRVLTLDAPVLSIGGAGTFDGVFLAGIVAVLLAAA